MTPIVIFSTGQSNFYNDGAFPHTPPTNASVWDFDKFDFTYTDVGSFFVPLPSATINAPQAFAERLAEDHPTRQVYLINIPIKGQSIDKWMTGSPTPDMYAACKNNVEAALAVLGIDKVDIFLWWQGEGNSGAPSSYVADWGTVHVRFKGEAWFPATTPCVIFGISALTSSTHAAFNKYLAEIAAQEPHVRTYSHTPYLPASFFDPTGVLPNIHLTGPGYHASGNLAYQQYEGRGKWGIQDMYFDPHNATVNVGSQTRTQRSIGFWNSSGVFQIQAVNSGDKLRVLSNAGDLLTLKRNPTLALKETVFAIRGRNASGAALLQVSIGDANTAGPGRSALCVPN